MYASFQNDADENSRTCQSQLVKVWKFVCSPMVSTCMGTGICDNQPDFRIIVSIIDCC